MWRGLQNQLYLRKIPGTFSIASSISSGVITLGDTTIEGPLFPSQKIPQAFEVKDHGVDLTHAEVVLQMILLLLLRSFGFRLGLRCHPGLSQSQFKDSCQLFPSWFICVRTLPWFTTDWVIEVWLTASVSSLMQGWEWGNKGKSTQTERVKIVCTQPLLLTSSGVLESQVPQLTWLPKEMVGELLVFLTRWGLSGYYQQQYVRLGRAKVTKLSTADKLW